MKAEICLMKKECPGSDSMSADRQLEETILQVFCRLTAADVQE